MLTVSQALQKEEGYTKIRALSSEQLLAVLSHLVVADEVERLLTRLEDPLPPVVPKMRVPSKPLKKKGVPAMVRSTGQIVMPVGRPPARVEYRIVETLEQAYREACRIMK